MALVNGTLAGITRIVTTHPFDPDRMLRIVEHYGVTYTMTAPSYLSRLLQSPNILTSNLSSMRHYLCGGSFVSPELVKKMNTFLPNNVCIAYGLSEVCGLVSANLRFLENSNSVGVLKEGMEARIVDDNGKLCGPESNGELYVRPPLPFLGYWRDEKATSDAIDTNGWFHTGDVGHFDLNGFLYVVDRRKDILKYRGYQISPSELENLILRCDGVAEVCVVGIPDPVSTDLPAAVVVRAIGKEVDRSKIEEIIKGNYIQMCTILCLIIFPIIVSLSDAKQLRGGVYFIESLPVTPSGKVLRRKVQEIAINLFREQL